MPKKIKLNLGDLKVQSFVTVLGNEEKSKILGGVSDPVCTFKCTTNTACTCYNSCFVCWATDDTCNTCAC